MSLVERERFRAESTTRNKSGLHRVETCPGGGKEVDGRPAAHTSASRERCVRHENISKPRRRVPRVWRDARTMDLPRFGTVTPRTRVCPHEARSRTFSPSLYSSVSRFPPPGLALFLRRGSNAHRPDIATRRYAAVASRERRRFVLTYPGAKEVVSFITHLAAALRGRTVPRRDRRRGGGGGGRRGGRRRRSRRRGAVVAVVVGGGSGGGSDGWEVAADRGRGKGRAKEEEEEEEEEEETAATMGGREDDGAEVEARVVGKSLRENVSR